MILLDTILTDKTLKSESQKDNTLMSSKVEKEKEKVNENENEKGNVDEKENEDENEDENKDMWLQSLRDVHDKLFKKYSNGKNFNSFIDEFDRARNEENKEKVVNKLKDINSFAEHYAQMEDDYNEYKCKLFDII